MPRRPKRHAGPCLAADLLPVGLTDIVKLPEPVCELVFEIMSIANQPVF